METGQGIRVVILREGDYWVAQCLEYDIGAQAKNLRDLRAHLDLTLQAELQESLNRHGEPFAGIDPAPKYFHDLWESRSGAFMPVEDPESRPADTPPYDMAIYA